MIEQNEEREAFAMVPVDRSYNMRTAAIMYFNTARKEGKDLDDALDAAWRAMLAKAHQPDGNATTVLQQQVEALRLQNAMIVTAAGNVSRDREALQASLLDPEAVLVNMLRGTIAKLSPRGIAKVYGQVLNVEDAQHVEIARLRAQLEEDRAALEKTNRIQLKLAACYSKSCRKIISRLRAALHSCAKASSAAEVGLIVDEVLAASQAQQALAAENQRVVPVEPLLAPRHPLELLAADHKGMRVDYSGMLKQSCSALRHGVKEPGLAELLRQLQVHMTELGQRWYRGDTAVVDELLQLYAVEDGARDALKKSQGGEK